MLQCCGRGELVRVLRSRVKFHLGKYKSMPITKSPPALHVRARECCWGRGRAIQPIRPEIDSHKILKIKITSTSWKQASPEVGLVVVRRRNFLSSFRKPDRAESVSPVSDTTAVIDAWEYEVSCPIGIK